MSALGLLGRYFLVTRGAWTARDQMASAARTPLERQFLPAALEILETPAPALPRIVACTIIAALAFGIGWATIGRIDLVAVAPGKIIAADKTKVIQPSEVGVVRKIHVSDGQTVKAGQVLVELEAAAMATGAETARNREALMATRLESARYDALARAASGTTPAATFKAPAGASKTLLEGESRAMAGQYQEHRAKLATLDAEIAKRAAEVTSVRELAAKLTQTLPIAQRRAEDYKNLVDQKFISQHGYLEREQVRIEQERDLAFQEARVRELGAGIEEARRRRDSMVAEFERAAINAKTDADKRAALLQQELVKAQTREKQQVLLAPVDGTVQQLAIHTVGGVVTPAQPLMVITPSDYQAEVEAFLENKDVGFVKVGQRAEVKVETFPFTRYGTLKGTVSFVSSDAVPDEKRGLIFQARVKLDQATLRVDQRDLTLTPGMAVSAEISTGKRRVIEFFLDPISKTMSEGLRER
jgi:hemolysin D